MFCKFRWCRIGKVSRLYPNNPSTHAADASVASSTNAGLCAHSWCNRHCTLRMGSLFVCRAAFGHRPAFFACLHVKHNGDKPKRGRCRQREHKLVVGALDFCRSSGRAADTSRTVSDLIIFRICFRDIQSSPSKSEFSNCMRGTNPTHVKRMFFPARADWPTSKDKHNSHKNDCDADRPVSVAIR